MASKAHVVVVGIGSIGCSLVPLLATLNLKRITLVDGDAIEPSNLIRQPLYGPSEIGSSKVEIAAIRVQHLAPSTEVISINEFVDASNIDRLFKRATVVADCTDDLHARLLIDGACAVSGTPLITGSVFKQQGQVMTLHVSQSDGGTGYGLRDYYPGRVGPEQDGCDMQQVPIMVPHMVAAVMARRIVDVLTGGIGNAEAMDLLDMQYGRWMRIGPPNANGGSELIASKEPFVEKG